MLETNILSMTLGIHYDKEKRLGMFFSITRYDKNTSVYLHLLIIKMSTDSMTVQNKHFIIFERAHALKMFSNITITVDQSIY